jgi:hypothetical protein
MLPGKSFVGKRRTRQSLAAAVKNLHSASAARGVRAHRCRLDLMRQSCGVETGPHGCGPVPDRRDKVGKMVGDSVWIILEHLATGFRRTRLTDGRCDR